MPIQPENRDRYPPDWPAISLSIRQDRAGWRCECDGRCGAEHCPGELGDGRCRARHGEPHPLTGSVVVLTTAHLDRTPENCRPDNLAAMCQRCHLVYDRDQHAANRRRTAERRRVEAGWEPLFDLDTPRGAVA